MWTGQDDGVEPPISAGYELRDIRTSRKVTPYVFVASKFLVEQFYMDKFRYICRRQFRINCYTNSALNLIFINAPSGSKLRNEIVFELLLI